MTHTDLAVKLVCMESVANSQAAAAEVSPSSMVTSNKTMQLLKILLCYLYFLARGVLHLNNAQLQLCLLASCWLNFY